MTAINTINTTHAIIAIAIMAVVTYMLRALPFFVFKDKRPPAYVEYLGKYLPYSIMGMLVVYCLKGTKLLQAPFGIPEIASVIIVILLHVWKRNTILSIVCGTLFYMIILRFI